MEGLINFFVVLESFLTFESFLLLLLSTTLGVVIGALPGLTATLGIALLTGLTFTVPKIYALTVLMGVYFGAIYGGSITAILINIPGTGSAAATCLDGYPLALKGEAGSAIRITRAASVFGTFFGALCLVLITPIVTKLALQFTSAEYFLLALFGILICGSVSASDLAIKGWAAGIIGIFIAMVGIDPLQGMARFTFGNRNLLSGINVIPPMIGFFAIPQIIKTLCSEKDKKNELQKNEHSGKKVSTIGMLLKHKWLIARSAAIGVGVGALPGVGENIAAWLAYGNAMKTSKHPKEFGSGIYEGIIAPEVANNAAIGGALIPLLSLAIPGSPPTAVLLGALLLHGIRPGPMLHAEFPMFLYEISSLLFLGSLMLWVVGVLFSKPLEKVITIPNGILMPIVAALCIIGSYSINNSMFDLVIMFVFGIIGYALTVMEYPSAAIVLGMILGGLLDENLRRALMVSRGSIMPFFVRPIALVFSIAVLYTIIGPFISQKIRTKLTDMAKSSGD